MINGIHVLQVNISIPGSYLILDVPPRSLRIYERSDV